MDQVFVKGIFDIGRVVVGAEEFLGVRLVIGEQKLRTFPVGAGPGDEAMFAEADMLANDAAVIDLADMRFDPASVVFAAPNPGVPVPQGGQEMKLSPRRDRDWRR